MTDPAIMVRAKITRDEWERLRVLAIKLNMPTSTVVGEMIRDFVNLHDPPPVDGERKRPRGER